MTDNNTTLGDIIDYIGIRLAVLYILLLALSLAHMAEALSEYYKAKRVESLQYRNLIDYQIEEIRGRLGYKG